MNLIRAERVQGMMPVDYLKWFAYQAGRHNRIAEIGCFRGRTTTALCDNCSGTVTAIDTWNGSPGLMDFVEFMQEETGDPDWLFHEFLYSMTDSTGYISPHLEILRMPSLEAAAFLQARNRQFDMVFIDGLHDYDNVKADILAWLPLLAPNGIMCGHDYKFDDVGRAVREIFPGIVGPANSDIWAVGCSVEELMLR